MKKPASFDHFIECYRHRDLIVQPRMGFSDWQEMRRGLKAVKALNAPTLGTITVDALTRQGLVEQAHRAVARGDRLNGYPLASYPPSRNQQLLAGLRGPDFPVQVRHGSPLPLHVFNASAAAGIDAIEGGPISYALPYGRVPLAQTIPAWEESARIWADHGAELGIDTHLESFAGCMMGQLCPPSLLVALGILEGLFFAAQGIQSLSLSYAQGTNADQDIGSLLALNQLAKTFLSHTHWHTVVYTWMGVFPKTRIGAEALIRGSARVAVVGGAQRLIVKTVAEAHGIPTVQENLEALGWCHEVAQASRGQRPDKAALGWGDEVYEEARQLVEAVLELDADIGRALRMAFARGYLDVPYCLHPDNRNQARAYVEPSTGVIRWQDSADLPMARRVQGTSAIPTTSQGLLRALSFNRCKYEANVS